jgi:hypothetical protein
MSPVSRKEIERIGTTMAGLRARLEEGSYGQPG